MIVNENYKYITISCILGFAFTVVIYNIDVILHWLWYLNEKRLILYPAITIFYFLLFYFLQKKLRLKKWKIFLIVIATPILIDSSVLFTNPLFVPLRFPFASIFPIIGAGLCTILYWEKKYYFGIGLLTAILLFFLSYGWILPKIYYYTLEKGSKGTISNSIFDSRFLTLSNNQTTIRDSINASCIILECFYVGCAPCEQKRATLLSLRKMFSKKQLSVLFICDGKITAVEDFKTYCNKNKTDGVSFFYDKDGVLQNNYDIKSYPFEIFCFENKVISHLRGFDEKLKEIYFEKTSSKIKKILNDKDD